MSSPEVKSISGGSAAPSTHLTWSDELNKRVRTGDWADQAISTTAKIRESIRSGDWENAAQLVDYWMEEAKVVVVIYDVWSENWSRYFDSKGVPSAVVEAESERLRRLLAFPDQSPFREGYWELLASSAGSLAHRMRTFSLSEGAALAALDDLKEGWRQFHDRGADFQSGLLTFVARLFGEAEVGEAYAFMLEPYLQERYAPFDIRLKPYEDTLFRNLYLSFEAMRGHLSGESRDGEIEVVESDEKFVLSFDPCGSGGRAQRGDSIEGTPSRSGAPYDFGVTTEEHDWAWNEKGVCYYCAHCCFALERWPAQQWGHPLRVIDSPLYPDETTGEHPKKCSWTIYKSIDAIPPEAYTRIGLSKPE